MVDTIRLVLALKPGQYQKILANLLSVTVLSNFDNDDSRETYTGYHKNFRVWLTPDRLRLEGSLAKYWLGNNLDLLSKADIKLALEFLSENLGVNIFPAVLKRVDVGRTFHVDQPVSEYLDSFIDDGSFKEYSRTKRQTKRFSKNNTTILLYDKAREMNNVILDFEEDEIPERKNLLRYELQSQKGLSQQYGYSSLRAVHLLSTSFLRKLEKSWRDSFFKILKKPSTGYKFGKWDVTSITEYLMILGIENSNGLAPLLNRIDEHWDSATDLEGYKRRYIKQKLKRLYKETPFTQQSQLFVEIEHEILTPYF